MSAADAEGGAVLDTHPGTHDDDALWRQLVFPTGWRNPTPAARYNLVVIGAGPAGLVTAIAAAGLGARVALVERYTKAGVDVFLGEARFVDAHTVEIGGQALRARKTVIATGARAAMPPVPGLAELPANDAEPASLVQAALQRDGVQLSADEVLVAVGRRRNVEGLGLERAGVRLDARGGIAVDARLRTSQPDVFAAGDVCSTLQFTHAADAQARIVVRNALFFGRARTDRLVVPWCTYTKPELAQVGGTRQQLEADGRRFEAFRFAFADFDRGRTDGDAEGYAEVRVASGTDRRLGATVVGRDAGELIAPLVMLMTLRQGLGALGSLVLSYPTRAEYLRRLVDVWNRTRLTPRTAAALAWWLKRSR